MGRRRSAHGGKVIDRVRWTGDVIISSFALGAGSSAGIQMYQLGDQEDPQTVMRTRGQVLVFVDGAQAPSNSVQVAIGVHVVPKGTDTTVLVSPLTEAEGDWLVWRTAALGYEEMVTDVVDVPGITSYRFEIDSKAMRKMKPGEELQFVATTVTAGGGGMSINLVGQLRTLLGS